MANAAAPAPAPAATSASSSSSNSASASGSGSSTLNIPQTAPAGLLTITQPPQQSTSYYKIGPGEIVTFAWSFTGILATPTSLTVSAICDNGNTYPVGPTDGHIPGTATSVTWDLYSWQQNNPTQPLAQASYRLSIWDDRGPNPTRAPGYLQPNSALEFALYTPQPYTPLASGWQCTGCSAALSNMVAHPAFAALIATFLVIFLSGFTILRGRRD